MKKKTEVTLELLQSLPKTDLHCHLDGSLRVESVIDMARQHNVELPEMTPAKLKKMLVMGKDCRSLVDYLKAFDITLQVMQWEDCLERSAYELALDAHAENVVYLEVRYAPCLHLREGLTLQQVNDAVLAGLKRAERETGIITGVIICGIRMMPPEESLRLAELAVEYKGKGVVGFDLAGPEANFPAKHHREGYYLVLDNNINCTCHAGEAFGPESISQALHYCGAHRIGHGTRLKENHDLLDYVNDHRIPLEICPTSNVQTCAVESMETHPLRFYYDYGLRVTINTDNRLISDTTVSKELLVACQTFNFSLNDVRNLIIHGVKSSFLGYHEKVKLLRRVISEIDEKCGLRSDDY